MNLLREYQQLRRQFGRQYWWPIVARDGTRLRPPQPLTEAAAVEIAVGAILTQNTAWSNVEKALIQLKRARVLSLKKILQLPTRRLAALVRSSGYYNQKALKLKAFASFIEREAQGKVLTLRAWPVPKARLELLKVHGIGEETADSMLLYAIGKPSFVIDSYTKRWLMTLGIERPSYTAYKEFFESQLPRRTALFKEFHAVLVAWGQTQAGRKTAPRPVVRAR